MMSGLSLKTSTGDGSASLLDHWRSCSESTLRGPHWQQLRALCVSGQLFGWKPGLPPSNTHDQTDSQCRCSNYGAMGGEL